MTAAANLSRLVETRVVGRVTNPYVPESVYLASVDGAAFLPIGCGGVHYNVRVGMGVFDFAADQVQPGVSIANPASAANQALTTFACVGNQARVHSGAAAGAVGVVTGRHEEFSVFQHVLLDFDDGALRALAPGDEVVVDAIGVGLRLEGSPAVDFHALSPQLWQALPLEVTGRGELLFPVVAVLPPQMVGIGSGRVSAATSICLQLDPHTELGSRLSQLRLGDLVAIRDWDGRFHTGYRPGATVVGVVTTGSSRWPGHGPSITLLASGREGMLQAQVVPSMNVAELLAVGTGRLP